MERIVVDGVGYHVVVSGDGPPVALLHGFTGSVATWQPFLPTLAARYRVIAIDQLGHGQTDAPDDVERYRIERAVADLDAILDWLGGGPAVWLGYSMGGRVALHLAVMRPEVVAGLILEGASPGIENADERSERARTDEALAASIERDGVEPFVDSWERLPLFAGQARLPAPTREALRRQRLANRPGGLANSLRGVGQGALEPLLDCLGSLGVPTLLIAGTEDAKFRCLNEQVAERLSCAQLAVIDRAGHAAHLEQPALFLETVLTFLGSLERNAKEWRQ